MLEYKIGSVMVAVTECGEVFRFAEPYVDPDAIIGSGTRAEPDDAITGAGLLVISGTASITVDDTATGTGSLTAAVIGSGSPVEMVDYSAGTGSTAIGSTGSVSESADTAVGVGAFADIISGTGSTSESVDTVTAVGDYFTFATEEGEPLVTEEGQYFEIEV